MLSSVEPNSTPIASQSKSLVFIDSSLDDSQSLAAGIKDGVEVYFLDRSKDGIVQIAANLQKFVELYGSLETVHIFSHGSPGQLHLGSTVLSSDNLEQYKTPLLQWGNAFKFSTPSENPSAILLYGCDVAAGEGTDFVEKLSQLTGVSIAASADRTGSAARGGNWQLEYTTAEIEAPAVLEFEAQAAYQGVLAALTVTNNADSGAGSLRDAIAAAQSGDTIIFDPSLAGQTIALTGGQLEIDKTLIIDGANAPGLTISGNNSSRVINLQASQNLTLKNLAIANGQVTSTDIQEGGGGIKAGDSSTLTVENCQFTNNIARLGGGIFAFNKSTLTVSNSTFDGNDATSGQGLSYREQSGGAIVAFVAQSMTVTNSQFSNNKGINGGAINNLLTPVAIENCTFLNNETTAGALVSGIGGYGGAVYSDGASNVNTDSIGGEFVIRNSRFEGNQGAGQGGGIYLYMYPPDRASIEGSTVLKNSVIKDDVGDALGGGVFYAGKSGLAAGNSPLTINNTTFANNTAADQGGALWVGENAPLNITNSTFSSNQAQNGGNGWGGALTVFNQSNPTAIVNTTFANNNAANLAGAIFHGDEQQITVTNTIFSNNTASNAVQNQQQVSRYLIDGGNNIQWPDKLTTIPFPGDLNVTPTVAIADPKLGPLQDNGGGVLTHALLPGSPAIDAGTNAGAPATDERGIARPQDGDSNGTALVDIGAYEFTSAAPEIEILNGTIDIADGTAVALNFGSTPVGTSVSQNFTIKNTGSAELNLSNLQLPAGFSVGGTLPATISPGGQATLPVNLDATAAGDFSGELSFATNDSDENPFNFAIAGTVSALPAPEIQVLEGTTEIADGTAVALNFGSTPLGTAIGKTFTIQNTGNTVLDLNNLQLPAGFSVAGILPATIPPGGQATLPVNLDATIAGDFSGELSFGTNDSDENPFNFSLFGSVSAADPTPPHTPNPMATPELCDQFLTPNFSPINPGLNPVINTLTGTGNDDTLTSMVGNEAINGAGGNDLLYGRDGSDNLDGGDGNDRLYGNKGNDVILGYAGSDTIFSGQENDTVFGGAADDIIAGNLGNDTLLGGKNNDLLYGNTGDDFIDGQLDNDTIFGGQNNDALLGGSGSDAIAGNFGNDTVLGQDGSDLLYGNTGDDFIDGGIGADTIFGGKDRDILKGGADNDIVAGNIGNDTICGGDGNDLLYGNVGADLLDGYLGDDMLFGGQENDTLVGNSGSDRLNGDLGNDVVYGNIGADTLAGGDGDDSLYGGQENDMLTGGIGNDNLNGDLGNDVVYGNTGADTLAGGDGDDSLYGGKDSDILTGGIGNDWLSGDLANDTLTGGGGSDRFIFSAGTGSDTITDFEDGIDLLGLSGGLTFADLTITQGASATLINIASTSELLASLNGVQATAIAADDFTLI